MSQALQSIREAAIDGRMQNVIWRQIQLETLQRALIEHADAIQAAIQRDCGYTETEAAIEYCTTLACLNEYYASLDADQRLEDEYAIARGQDAEARREAVGIVYIVPTAHTFFYSVNSALGAAWAAGNCVVIEIQESIRLGNISALLRKLLKYALDQSIVQIISSRASEEDLSPNHVRLVQDVSQIDHQTPTKIVAPPTSSTQTVAIVDRTADLVKAAESLAAARLAFGGSSPYAPDVVLVNEFVKKQFLVALTQAVINQWTLRSSESAEKLLLTHKTETQTLIAAEIGSKKATPISSIGGASIVNINNRDSKLLQSKIVGYNIMLHSVRSLDDAIDLANRDGDLLATYLFSDVKSGKYLSQFVPSRVSFVNQIPVEILIGPSAPEASAVNRSLHVRYPTDLFSIPRPQYIANSLLSEELQGCLVKGEVGAFQSRLVSKISKQLAVSSEKRPEGSQVGFFEQGILTGLGLFGIPVLLGMGTATYFGLNLAWRNIKLRWISV